MTRLLVREVVFISFFGSPQDNTPHGNVSKWGTAFICYICETFISYTENLSPPPEEKR